MARVLIVDDEKTPSVLASQVRALGHWVQVARDAEAALGAFSRSPFDVVFASLRMASLDGLALLREIRRRWPDVVVLVTEYATVPEAAEAIREGTYDYCVESFTAEHVGHLLDRVLEERAVTRQ